jgi:hypothetical protein
MSERVIYPSAARTATPTAVELNTSRCKALRVVIDVTAIVATPLLTVTIDGKDNLSGKYYNLLTSAVIGTAVTTVLTIALGATVAANLVASLPLDDVVRITVSHGDADSATYSVSAHLIR